MVEEHRQDYPSQWSAIESIAGKIGCSTTTLLKWVRRYEVDTGTRAGVTSEERERIKIWSVRTGSCAVPMRS